MYKVLREGSEEGKGKKAMINTPCKCHYAGTLVDGTEFDSSYKRGAVSSSTYRSVCACLGNGDVPRH